MESRIESGWEWLTAGARDALAPRWLFLRALGLVFFSAFGSLYFQVLGLVGSRGILPAGEYLGVVRHALSAPERYRVVPSLLWLTSGDQALVALTVVGMVSAALLTANVWPRATILVCEVLFISAIAVLQDFASYQSDSMLAEAGLLALFFAPRGLWPGLGRDQPPSRLSLFALRWEWFCIYFESGVAKLASGDPQWRHLTAMDHYYENGPLPTWIGWWAQQLPHGWHAFCALFTLVAELGLVWMAWLPRRFRIATFLLVTPLQIGIILTANYAFLNDLVLALGFLLLDDRLLASVRLRPAPLAPRPVARWRRIGATGVLGLVLWASAASFLPLPGALGWPARWLAPFRVADRYGLFAVMTRARYEIEFQGTLDGTHWVPYRFRYKPQDPSEAPGIYAPYQPRFEWNLWFASLAPWQANPWIVNAEARLLERSPDVLALFRGDPFHGTAPHAVRTVRWRYWFTGLADHRATGDWWRRRELGAFAPTVERAADGTLRVLSEP